MSPKLVRSTPAATSLIAQTSAPPLQAKVETIGIPGASTPQDTVAGGTALQPANGTEQPQPVSDADLDGLSKADQLKRLEEAMASAQNTHDNNSLAVRARYVIEMGTALRHINQRALYVEAGVKTFEEYVAAAEIGVRSRAYQLMDNAQAMTRVIVSKILDKTPNESQAVFLNALLDKHEPDDVKAVVQLLEDEGKKPTVSNLKAAATELKLIPKAEKKPALRGKAEKSEPAPADPVHNLRVALKGLQGAYSALTPSAQAAARQVDQQAAGELLADIGKLAAGILRRVEQNAETVAE
ncbi:hypothetical protein ABT095_35965 [Kitasatospora sp. NPDC002227]|uniref:hypothetical protein n=1 Tax=Kitasatospora sp. NPDC002227 TaxID=3154773 RepID=UPI00331A2CDC